MKTILCACGKFIKVDDAVFEHLIRFSWTCKNQNGVYNQCSKPMANCVKYKPKKGLIWDHIDRDKHNNQEDSFEIESRSDCYMFSDKVWGRCENNIPY